MVNEGCYYGVLSSEDGTILFTRRDAKDKHNDTLYMSKTYPRDDCPILAVFCWMAAAYGLAKVHLPEPVCTWNEEDIQAQSITASGVTRRLDQTFLQSRGYICHELTFAEQYSVQLHTSLSSQIPPGFTRA